MCKDPKRTDVTETAKITFCRESNDIQISIQLSKKQMKEVIKKLNLKNQSNPEHGTCIYLELKNKNHFQLSKMLVDVQVRKEASI